LLAQAQKVANLCGMHHIKLLILLVSLTAFLFLMIGLIKPWVMLWWEDVQNRKKVIKLYGTVALLFYVIYLLLDVIEK